MSTRILLADDHKLAREMLHELIDKQPGMKVVAEAEGGLPAVRLARELSPDVVLIDVSMPDSNGIEATRRIVAEVPGIKIIAVSMHSDRRFVTGMLAAGARGYLLKDRAAEELAHAIRTVMANETYLSQRIAGIATPAGPDNQRSGPSGGDHAGQSADEDNRSRAASSGQRRGPERAAEGAPAYSPKGRARRGVLTPREREVLRFLAEGRTAKQIASQLHVSVKTIEEHRRQIMRKVGVDSIAELRSYAVREGLIPLDD
jgi:DNA-binding NarL/FixJ family response regulator